MREVKEVTQTIVQKVHEFHCDHCKKLVGTSVDSAEGNYEYKGEVEIEVFYNYKQEQTMACLCPECYQKLLDAISTIAPFTYHEEDDD